LRGARTFRNGRRAREGDAVTESSMRKLSDESRGLRLKLYELCKQGKTEEQALFELLPDDHDRFFRFLEWQQMGLWPPPELDDLTESIESGTIMPSPSTESGLLDLSRYEIPQVWMERISGLIRATVNAAVLDYHGTQSDQIEAVITSLIDEKIARALERDKPTASAQLAAPEVLPPPRPKKGDRRAKPKRAKLEGTCDKVLFDLFEDDRKTRKLSVPQMIDFILFNYYGKPKLSFQED
jgi:hypothetical protein